MSGDRATVAVADDEMVTEFNGLPVASLTLRELADKHARIIFLGVGNQDCGSRDGGGRMGASCLQAQRAGLPGSSGGVGDDL